MKCFVMVVVLVKDSKPGMIVLFTAVSSEKTLIFWSVCVLWFVSLVFCCIVSCVLLSPPSRSFWSLIGCPMMWCMFVIGGSDEAGLYKDGAAGIQRSAHCWFGRVWD